ncbi:MAG: type III pantothenate kinase [Clostridia bacterium]|nr:type III pantothenate kinase [Clostridia bacterium]
MLLAIDIGNTNIVVGCCDGERICFMERLTTNHTATEMEYAIALNSVLSLKKTNAQLINGAIISSVVPSVTNSIKEAVRKLTGVEALIIGPGIKTGLSIKTDDPAKLGSDLVVDAVAAINEYGAPAIVFDMGTATTISVINSNSEYLGTIIMPGMMISLNAMVSGTSQLPKISLDRPKRLIGTNSADCMKSGILYGTASGMDGMIDRIREEIGDVKVIATGGLAGTVVPLCKNDIILDDELLIKGLMIIYNKNTDI